jgi:hypothetical protein
MLIEDITPKSVGMEIKTTQDLYKLICRTFFKAVLAATIPNFSEAPLGLLRTQ